MKKTIREDLERDVQKTELINDNTLMEYVRDGDNICVDIRFIDGGIGRICEHTLLTMDIVSFFEHAMDVIQFNDEGDTIALFNVVDDGYELSRIYDLTEHSFVSPDFLEFEYKKRFPDIVLNKRLRKERRAGDD